MAAKVMKVSSKGQVTLPREVRDVLGSDVVAYEVRDGQVLLLPVKDVGGSLKEYARKPPMPFRRARKKAWEGISPTARRQAGIS